MNETTSQRAPALWDTLIVAKSGKSVECVCIRVYESGRLKVRFPSGHISVIPPSDVLANRGYVRDDATENILNMLIKGKWK